jgi:hypothetical protein
MKLASQISTPLTVNIVAMKQSTNLLRELSRAIDLWTLLNDAEQIVINNEYLHPRMHQRIGDLMKITETYQTAIEHQLEQLAEYEP